MSVLRGYEILDLVRRKINDSSYSTYDDLNAAQRWISQQTNFTWLRKRSTTSVAAISGTSQYTLNLANAKALTGMWIAPASTSTAINISAITLSGTDNVVITTSAAHSSTTGDYVTFVNVGGTSELNGNTYTVTVLTTTTFSLDGTNSSDFTAWTSGGTTNAWSTENSQWRFMEEAPSKVFEEKVKSNDQDTTTNITASYSSLNWYYYLESGSTVPFYTIYITPTPDSTMMIRVDYTRRLTDIDPDNFADIPPEYIDSLVYIASGYALESSDIPEKQIKGAKYISRGERYFNPLVNDSQMNRTKDIDRPDPGWIY